MDCVERQFEAIRDTELVKDVVQVILYSLLADEEPFADFLVVKALSDELNDFHLSRSGNQFGRRRRKIRRPLSSIGERMKEDHRTLHIDTPFAQFAEPMTAVLADHRELSSSLPAFAASHSHFFIRLA